MKAEPDISGQPLNLHPLNDCVLVELKQSSNNFNVKVGKYDSYTEGVVIGLPDEKSLGTLFGVEIKSSKLHFLAGKRIYFQEFKDNEPIKRGGKLYSFIKIADILGYEE